MPSQVTQIEICNSALLKVGADVISDIEADDRTAVVCNTLWNSVRDQVLREHPWHFAVKRAVLAPTGTTPLFEYAYAYDLPNDCIRMLGMDDPDIDWIVESGQILSNETTLNAHYIFRCEDESLWDPSFGEAFSWKLAEQICYALTQSLPLKQEMTKGYKEQLAMARSMNGVEGIMKGLIADTWSQERLGYPLGRTR